MRFKDDTEPKPELIYLPWEIEFNAIYLKGGFSKFEIHGPFLDLLVKLRYPVTVNWLREWLGFGLHPDERVSPDISRGRKFVFELHEPRDGDEVIPDGISLVFWSKLVADGVNVKEGGKLESGGIPLDELKAKYPELSARAAQESKG